MKSVSTKLAKHSGPEGTSHLAAGAPSMYVISQKYAKNGNLVGNLVCIKEELSC